MENLKEKIMNKLRDLIKINLSTEEQAAISSFKPAVMVVKAAEVKTKDGLITLSFDGDALAIGTPLMDVTSGTPVPAMDGEYTLEDDSVITVVGGMVTEMETPEAAIVEEAPAMPTEVPATMMNNQKTIEELKASNVTLANQLVLLTKAVDALLDAPIGGKIADAKSETKSFNEMTALEKHRYMKAQEKNS